MADEIAHDTEIGLTNEETQILHTYTSMMDGYAGSFARTRHPESETMFDQRALFDEKLKDHLHAIKKLCVIKRIPFYATFCVANNEEEGSVYVSDGYIPTANRIVLADDRFVRHVNVDAGFDTVPPRGPLHTESDSERRNKDS